jgi:hypothetical protein
MASITLKRKLNNVLDVILGLLLFVSMFALLPGEINRSAPGVILWNLLHEITGTVLLALVIWHLTLHWSWIKSVVLRRRVSTPSAVRRNRVTDLGLFGVALPCALTGLMVWGLPGIWPAPLGLALTEWRDLHNWSGVLMLVGLILHLAWHWKWIVFTLRRLLPSKAHSDTQSTTLKVM